MALETYIEQMCPRFGQGLIKALEQKRFGDARALIVNKKGINSKDAYDQTPLLLVLLEGPYDLAGLLIRARSDVNAKSKMHMTPLRVATQAGNLEMVKHYCLSKALHLIHRKRNRRPFFMLSAADMTILQQSSLNPSAISPIATSPEKDALQYAI